MHGLAYDDLHDEIVVPVALSGAVLVFRGGATGDEAPLRVIQGSKTGMIRPQTVEVDPVNNEIVAADSSSRAILIYDRMANGDVEPKRKIGGSRRCSATSSASPSIAKRNLIIASTRSTDGFSGILMFDRMANGRRRAGAEDRRLDDRRTRRIPPVEGRLRTRPGVPRRPELSAAHRRRPRRRPTSTPTRRRSRSCASSEARRGGSARARDPFTSAGFIGAWSLDDDGNVPPRIDHPGPVGWRDRFCRRGVQHEARRAVRRVRGAERVCRVDRPGVLSQRPRNSDSARAGGRLAGCSGDATQWAMGKRDARSAPLPIRRPRVTLAPLRT